MIHAKNYEKLSKFVKVTAKILLIPFFGTWCISLGYMYYHKIQRDTRTLIILKKNINNFKKMLRQECYAIIKTGDMAKR